MMVDLASMGQEQVWREWRDALASRRLHHAWLLSGAKGLGKAAFARAAAMELVGKPVSSQTDIEAHPDILLLDHLPANDDEAKKKAEGKPYQVKRNITVDQVRSVIRRLATKPTLGDRRAIIIDPVDDMENGAINALLKALEEPPTGTYFLLITHQPGRLLPTVRSRCRMLRFAPLSADRLDVVLREHAPNTDSSTRATAIAAAQGMPGIAIDIVEHDLGQVYGLMSRILENGDADFALRGALAEEIGARPSRDRQLAALELARSALVGTLRASTGTRQRRVIEAHAALSRLATQAPTFNFDAGLLIMEIGGLLASVAMPREAAH